MRVLRLAGAGALAALLLAGCRSEPQRERAAAEGAYWDWPEPSRAAASALIDEYGPPDRTEAGVLVWLRRGPWQRIRLKAAAPGSRAELEQTVALSVPPSRRPALARFSADLRVSPLGDALSARSGSEEANRLALNLAYEIIAGRLGPDAARAAYDRALSLAAAGKDQPLMRELRLPVPGRPGSSFPIAPGLEPDRRQRSPLWKNTPRGPGD